MAQRPDYLSDQLQSWTQGIKQWGDDLSKQVTNATNQLMENTADVFTASTSAPIPQEQNQTRTLGGNEDQDDFRRMEQEIWQELSDEDNQQSSNISLLTPSGNDQDVDMLGLDDEKTERHHKRDISEDDDWAFLDDFTGDGDNEKNKDQILNNIWSHLVGERFFERLFSRRHWKAVKLWERLCHRIECGYPKAADLNPYDLSQPRNAKLLADLQWAAKHAVTVYPPLYLLTLGATSNLALAVRSCRRNVSTRCGIDYKNGFLLEHLAAKDSRLHRPNFYLAVDHSVDKLVLCVRGSSSISDAITDLNAEPKVGMFGDVAGSAHPGMLSSAMWVREQVEQLLVNALETYRNYTVVITGHSLGAGVASLLGVLWHDHKIIAPRMKVYSFASPCVVSKHLSSLPSLSDKVYTINLSTDMVTRLSLQSIKKNHRRLDLLRQYRHVVKDALIDLSDPDPSNDAAAESTLHEFLRALREAKAPQEEDKLYPAGNVIWLVPRICMNDNICYRRQRLMRLHKSKKYAKYIDEQNIQYAKQQSSHHSQQSSLDSLDGIIDNLEIDDDAIIASSIRTANNKDTAKDNWDAPDSSEIADFFDVPSSAQQPQSQQPQPQQQQSQRRPSQFEITMQQGWNNVLDFLKLDKANSSLPNLRTTDDGSNTYGGDDDSNTDATLAMGQVPGSKWIMCDATNNREIFQEFVFEFFESLYAHFPQRYLMAIGTSL